MKTGNSGFTLIELMVATAIIGILAAMAYPSYTKYKIRTQRIDAQSEMLQIAQRMQTYRAANSSFAGATIATVYGGGDTTPKQGTALYKLTFNPVTTTANGWTLIAKPITGTPQAGNGWICLNDQGQKSWTKSVDSCSLSPTSKWTDR